MPKRLFDGGARRAPRMDLPLSEFSPPKIERRLTAAFPPYPRLLEKVSGEEVSSEVNDR
jgi:hypothetical protein